MKMGPNNGFTIVWTISMFFKNFFKLLYSKYGGEKVDDDENGSKQRFHRRLANR